MAWPYLASAALHLLLLIVLLLMPAEPANVALRRAPVQVRLVQLPPKTPPSTAPKSPAKPAPPKPPVVHKPAAPPPKPPAAAPKQATRPRPAPIPEPTRSPKAKPSPQAEDKVAILRTLPELKTMSDEDLKAIELPPGVKSWKDFIKLAKEIGMFKAAFPPPTTTGQTGNGETTPAVPWQWETTDGGERGVVALDTGILTVTWKPTDAQAAATFARSDAEAAPVAFTIPIGPGSDREAIANAALMRLPVALSSASPAPAPSR